MVYRAVFQAESEPIPQELHATQTLITEGKGNQAVKMLVAWIVLSLREARRLPDQESRKLQGKLPCRKLTMGNPSLLAFLVQNLSRAVVIDTPINFETGVKHLFLVHSFTIPG